MLLCGLYLDTIDPKTEYERLLSYDVVISVFLHTIIYLVMICIFTFLLDIKLTKNVYIKLGLALIIIMTLGYPGRLARSK